MRPELHAEKTQPFQKIPDAVRSTGLSAYYLRNGIKDGTVPHIRSGRVLYVNIPALLRQLGADPGGETNE